MKNINDVINLILDNGLIAIEHENNRDTTNATIHIYP